MMINQYKYPLSKSPKSLSFRLSLNPKFKNNERIVRSRSVPFNSFLNRPEERKQNHKKVKKGKLAAYLNIPSTARDLSTKKEEWPSEDNNSKM